MQKIFVDHFYQCFHGWRKKNIFVHKIVMERKYIYILIFQNIHRHCKCFGLTFVDKSYLEICLKILMNTPFLLNTSPMNT